MSLVTPTTQGVADNIVSQIEATINQTVPLLPKAFIRVMAKSVAGVQILLYKYAGFSLLQQFVQFASDQQTVANGKVFTPLTQWGRLIGVGDPTAATRWEGTTEIIVTNQTGSLPDGTALLNAANGVTYTTIGVVTLDAATKSATIRAAGDEDNNGGRGTIGNLEIGDTVSFINPQANVESDTTVTAETTTGADAEGTEVYRQRIIDRFQQQPQGGAAADYKQWSETVEGIINTYPYRGDPGEVDVYCEATAASSGSADGFPTASQITEIAAAIEYDDVGLASRRPLTVYVNVYSISRTAFDVDVVGLALDGGLDTTQLEADITTAVTDYFTAREPFISGLTLSPRKDRLTRAEVQGVIQGVVNANNGIMEGATISTGGVDHSIYPLQEGEKAKLGTITFL
ncbi:MAG: hypothetical protein GY841_22235 [FCB group bacterium]|nr:hypothetical protein [FCB group bacterium]